MSDVTQNSATPFALWRDQVAPARFADPDLVRCADEVFRAYAEARALLLSFRSPQHVRPENVTALAALLLESPEPLPAAAQALRHALDGAVQIGLTVLGAAEFERSVVTSHVIEMARLVLQQAWAELEDETDEGEPDDGRD